MSHSKRWLAEHLNDPYVKKARQEGYRSRSAYKLLELQDKYRFIKPGMTVIDLGAAPGGWTQVAAHIVGEQGIVFALDILPMDGIAGVQCMQGDFREASVLEHLIALTGSQHVDVVLSDMSPNISGQKIIDQPRGILLVELAMDYALQRLRPGGCFLTKIFQGSGVDPVIKILKQSFQTLRICKPQASRLRSSEIYALGLCRR